MSSPRNWLWPESRPAVQTVISPRSYWRLLKNAHFCSYLATHSPPPSSPVRCANMAGPVEMEQSVISQTSSPFYFFYFLLNKSSSCAYFPRLRLPEGKCGLSCSSGFIKASESCLIFWGCKSGSVEISHLSIVRSGKNSPALFPQHVRSLAFNQCCCRVVLKPHTCQEGQLILGTFFFFLLFLIFDWTKCLIATDVCRQWGCTNHPGRLLSI